MRAERPAIRERGFNRVVREAALDTRDDTEGYGQRVAAHLTGLDNRSLLAEVLDSGLCGRIQLTPWC